MDKGGVFVLIPSLRDPSGETSKHDRMGIRFINNLIKLNTGFVKGECDVATERYY